MDGIFNYAVPNRSVNTSISSNTRTNTYQNTTTGTSSSFGLTNSERTNIRQLFGLNDNVRNLVQDLLRGVNHNPSGSRPPTDVTTMALGEEDGGSTNPPQITTYAMGEEDGGIGNRPPQITTLALGEEDGGITC